MGAKHGRLESRLTFPAMTCDMDGVKFTVAAGTYYPGDLARYFDFKLSSIEDHDPGDEDRS